MSRASATLSRPRPDTDDPAERPTCSNCDGAPLAPRSIEMALWRGLGLVVIRNVPAMVCPCCGERYLADETVLALDRMRGGGIGPADAVDRMIVPVLDYAPPGRP